MLFTPGRTSKTKIRVMFLHEKSLSYQIILLKTAGSDYLFFASFGRINFFLLNWMAGN